MAQVCPLSRVLLGKEQPPRRREQVSCPGGLQPKGRQAIMPRYDRVLIQPTRTDLERALLEAATAANRRGQQRLLSWPPTDQQRVLDRVDATAEGHHQWNGGESEGRSAQQSRSVVVLAWWTDLIGRKHCRVVGRRGRFNRHLLHNLLCPAEEGPRPTLWLVYPDYVFLKCHQGRRV